MSLFNVWNFQVQAVLTGCLVGSSWHDVQNVLGIGSSITRQERELENNLDSNKEIAANLKKETS